MKKIKSALFIIGIALFLAGCYQTKQDYTVNPDGSGKAAVKITMQLPNMNFGEKQNKDSMLKSTVKNIIDKSKGVEAWTDITYSQNKKGEIEFKGTAYFQDVNKVSFGEYGGWDVKFASLDSGKQKLELTQSKKEDKKESPEPATESTKNLTDEQIKEKIDIERQNYHQSRGFMAPMFEKMRTEMTFRLPGEIDTATNFTREKDGTISFIFEWKKIMDVLDKMIEDDAWMKEQMKNKSKGGASKPELDEKFMTLIFPDKGGITAVIKASDKALFNYKKEVAAALKKHQELLNKINSDK